MQINPNLFDKYKELKFKPTGMLFDIDWKAVRTSNRCPLCGNKLYPMMSKDYIYCKSKKHKRFVIKKWK